MKVQSGVLQLQSAVQGHRAWARQGVAGSVAFSLALLVAAPARADRAEIYRPPELVAMADVVVLGRVVSVQAAPSSKDVAAARITVDKISKGKLSAAQIEVRYHSPGISATPPQLISRYSLQLRQGNRYFFFLMAPVAGETFYRLVEDRDGAQPYSPGMGAEVAREVRDGQGRFRLNARAVRALLLAEAYTVPVNGHVTLKVLLQPVAKAGARYSLVRWPEARMSWAELLVRRDGKPVAHSRIPWLSKSESESYFKARQPFDMHIRRFGVLTVHFQRINSAVRGWGYKEELGFRYYPLTVPGRYEIRARLHRTIVGIPVIETAPVNITVTAPTSPQTIISP